MSNWTSLGTTGNFAAGPSVGKNADGSLEAFIWKSGVDGVVELMHIRKHAPSGRRGCDGWSSLSSSSYGLVFESSPAIAANDDGRQEVFTTSFNGELLHIWQLATGGWSSWTSLTSPANVALSPLIGVHVNDDGRLEAFATGSDNALWHIWQLAPNANWGNWASLGKPLGTSYITAPHAAQNEDGRLEAFVIGSDNALWHIWQTTPGGGWGNWFSSGTPIGANIGLSSPFLRKNDDGRLEIFVTVTSRSGAGEGSVAGALWHIWQNTPNGKWSNWASLGSPSAANWLSEPFVRKNDDGRLEAFLTSSDDALWHIWQNTTGGAWGNWASLGSPSNSVSIFGTPFVAENDDGRLEAFILASDGALWHTWQVSPGGAWG